MAKNLVGKYPLRRHINVLVIYFSSQLAALPLSAPPAGGDQVNSRSSRTRTQLGLRLPSAVIPVAAHRTPAVARCCPVCRVGSDVAAAGAGWVGQARPSGVCARFVGK